MLFNKYKISQVSLALTAAFLSQQAIAKSANDTTENIVVIGKYQGAKPNNLAGSYEIIGRDQLLDLHVDDNVELFTKLPGISLSRYNQGPINADLSIRGFDGDGGSPHAKLIIDGIATNLHQGYAEMDQIFSLGIDSIQAFKGTSDVRYGLFNIAGNYQINSRSDVDTTQIEATYGSYNTTELQAYTGQQTGKLTHNYSLGYRQSEGYRDNTDLERYAIAGKWFYQINADIKLGFISRYAHFDADAPGYLSKEAARANPTSSASYASEDGGDKTTVHNSIHLNSQFDQVKIDANAYWQTFERERWVRFSQAGSLQNRYDDQQQTGLNLNAQYQINSAWTLTAGLSHQQEDVIEQRFGTTGQSRIRDTSNVIRNYDYSLDSTGVFTSVENQLTDNFKWNFGVRADKLAGDFVQIAADGTQNKRDIYDFGWIVQSKLNVFYQATQNWQLFFNFGESFQHPYGSSLYTAGDVNSRDVSKNVGWEAGTSFSPITGLNIRLSSWQQNAKDEFVLVDGTSVNVGKTERSGWELAASYPINDNLSIWANYSLVDTKIVNPGEAGASNIGNELRSIPEYTASVGIDAYITDQFKASLHIDSQGDYYVNEANEGGQYGDYTLAHMSFNYTLDNLDISLNLNNLFDQYYEYVYDFSSDGSGTIHSPGDGRNASISARFTF
ncbi:TonB-dependent receptor [Catenovulum sp. SX2]|uniref:TonB-dependent receptor n=1 Tax=Catenovulum sp. SX2 TaxID=3398614 RepID=UPI003F84CC0E